jgi:hypothetical protein
MLDAKEEKDRERRRKRYKFALVRWDNMEGWEDTSRFGLEYKDTLKQWWITDCTVLCDDQPEKVLRAMLKLMEEDKDG